MRTYRQLFRVPEYTPLFATMTSGVAAQVLGQLALGVLVFRATHSPLLSALIMFSPQLAQLAGAVTLLSAADRLPPRAALTGIPLIFGAVMAIMALPGLPVWAMFPLTLALGMVASVGGGVRYGLLTEIVPPDGYVLGRSVLNMAVGTTQICGFAVGGALVALVSARGTLCAAAALYAVAAAVARFGLRRHRPRSTGRPSVAATWRINARLWSSVPRRYVFIALWVPNGLIVGCESLFVPYSPGHAGVLLATAAFGMLLGDILTGRFMPLRWRERLSPPLRLLLAAPYLVFVLHPPLPVAVTAIALASIGYSAALLLQERLMNLTPQDLQGQALGLTSSGMMACQGLGAALAGGIAQFTGPATAMTITAAASTAVTLVLAHGLSGDVDAAQPASSNPEPVQSTPA
jgi:predicted MFS family arabinose efflux permease